MNTKQDCWLCGRGTGIGNGSMGPGELKQDEWGDLVCIYCEARMNFMAQLLANPQAIVFMSELRQLPRVERMRIGIQFERDE